jgi:hypothetical protein
MKSNLAVLSSDNKTIQFIKNNNLEDLCNLYANSSRNTDDAKIFSEIMVLKNIMVLMRI